MDHKVVPCPDGIFLWSHYHDLIFKKMQFLKALDPSLGVNRTWTKRSDHALESGFSFMYICPKRTFLGLFSYFTIFSSFL